MKQFTRRFELSIKVEGVIEPFKFVVWKTDLHNVPENEINREHCKVLAKGICLTTFRNLVYAKASPLGRPKAAFVKTKLENIKDSNLEIKIDLKGEFDNDDCYKCSNFQQIAQDLSDDEVANHICVTNYTNRLLEEYANYSGITTLNTTLA